MKITIVGPGAMGCLFAAKLSEAGVSATLLDHNEERARRISDSGIALEEGGETRTVKVACVADPQTLSDADGVIFMVKAFSTADAVERVKDFVPAGAWAMSIQNGMGNAEILTAAFGEERAFAGTTSHGATLLGEGRARHAGAGPTWIGKISDKNAFDAAAIADMFSRAGFETAVSDDVQKLLWKKLFINVGINPITALLRIRNGEILERESALEVARAAVYEACLVADLAGVDIGDDDPFELVMDIMKRTAENISSMCQDVSAGRRTEIENICGYVARRGEELGQVTPMNNYLLGVISSIKDSEE